VIIENIVIRYGSHDRYVESFSHIQSNTVDEIVVGRTNKNAIWLKLLKPSVEFIGTPIPFAP
jgi:hypothetical protein